MTIPAQPFPRPGAQYEQSWASVLIQRLDKFLLDFVQGERIVQRRFITLGGRQRKVTTVTAGYQILLTDEVVDSNVSTAITHTLPAGPSRGQEFIVQDSSGNASANPISVAPPSGITLNGAMVAVQLVAADYGRGTVIYNGSQYIAA